MRVKAILFINGILLMMMVISMTGCDLIGFSGSSLTAEDRVQTGVAETMALEIQVQTVVAGTLAASGKPAEDQAEPVSPPPAEQAPPPANTNTPEPAIAFTPTTTITPMPEKPMVSVSRNMNCRTGPDTVYDIVGVLMVGAQAEVVGAFPDWNYWIIKNPDKAGECWLWGEYATVVGETATLPRYTPPPTPTPTFTPTPVFNWTGTWTLKESETDIFNYMMDFTQTGSSVTGTGSIAGVGITISGTLSADFQTLTGTWQFDGDTGPFIWKLISNNQFVGNYDNYGGPWCGHRAGAGFPDPCLGP